MELATVSLEVLAKRINSLLGTTHSTTYISGVRNGNAGSPALRHLVQEATATILQEAADAAKPVKAA